MGSQSEGAPPQGEGACCQHDRPAPPRETRLLCFAVICLTVAGLNRPPQGERACPRHHRSAPRRRLGCCVLLCYVARVRRPEVPLFSVKERVISVIGTRPRERPGYCVFLCFILRFAGLKFPPQGDSAVPFPWATGCSWSSGCPRGATL